MRRHEREIFPLLRRRHLFAEVDHFYLYDLWTPEGSVNEDVYAYSNRSGDERVLVVYHNKYAETRGWIRTSVGYAGKIGSGEERVLMRKPLGSALGLNPDADHFTIYRDHASGLEFIRSNKELCDQGLYVELAAYEHHVFLDFRQVRDNESHQYANLAASLNGRGTPSVAEALWEIFLWPIHQPFKELINADVFRQLLDACVADPHGQIKKDVLDGVEQKTVRLLLALKQFIAGAGDETARRGGSPSVGGRPATARSGKPGLPAGHRLPEGRPERRSASLGVLVRLDIPSFAGEDTR